MSYTPGPWEACHNGKCQCKTVWSKPSDHPVATIISGNWGDNYPSIRIVGESSFDRKAEAYMEQIAYGSVHEDFAEANARLIAAAPELLEACKAALCFIQNGVDLGFIRMPDKDVPDPAHKTPLMLSSAIAKAEGL